MDPTDPVEVYKVRERLLQNAWLLAGPLAERSQIGRGVESLFDENVDFSYSSDPDALYAAAAYSIAILAAALAEATGRTCQDVIQEQRAGNNEAQIAAEILENLRDEDP